MTADARRIYVDTSAYLCLILSEKGHEAIVKETAGAQLFSSVLLVLEARRTLTRLAREGAITAESCQQCLARVDRDIDHFALRDLTLDVVHVDGHAHRLDAALAGPRSPQNRPVVPQGTPAHPFSDERPHTGPRCPRTGPAEFWVSDVLTSAPTKRLAFPGLRLHAKDRQGLAEQTLKQRGRCGPGRISASHLGERLQQQRGVGADTTRPHAIPCSICDYAAEWAT